MDVQNGSIYVSNYLNEKGKLAWSTLLQEAAEVGNDDTLANALRTDKHLKSEVERRKPKGGYTMVRVPVTAHETMGEGEFNRYYVRGLCRRAIDNGIASLTVYRAKSVKNARPGSEEKIGQLVDPQTVLKDLRETTGVEPALGLPPGPNSGICLRI